MLCNCVRASTRCAWRHTFCRSCSAQPALGHRILLRSHVNSCLATLQKSACQLTLSVDEGGYECWYITGEPTEGALKVLSLHLELTLPIQRLLLVVGLLRLRHAALGAVRGAAHAEAADAQLAARARVGLVASAMRCLTDIW